jgi:hypothetical protein
MQAQQRAAQQQAAQQQAFNQRQAKQQVIQQSVTSQLVKVANGSATINLAGETYYANTELLGDDGQISLIKMVVADQVMQIQLNDSDNDEQTTGQLTPCDGGICQCGVSANESEALVWGSCTNSAHPEFGEMSFSIQLN